MTASWSRLAVARSVPKRENETGGDAVTVACESRRAPVSAKDDGIPANRRDHAVGADHAPWPLPWPRLDAEPLSVSCR